MIFSLPIYTSSGESNTNWYQSLIKIHPWWWETYGENVTIALLDSGIDGEHPALKNSITRSVDCTLAEEEWAKFLEDPQDIQDLQDDSGHGTHCAGIMIGFDGEKNFEGIAKKAKLHVYKILRKRQGDWTYATRALEEILKWNASEEREKNPLDKVRIINMSISGQYPTDEFYRALHLVLASGICVIAAAGNEGGRYQNGIGYPGKYGGVITVAAHDEYGRPSPFSSSGGEIDFMAPGTKVNSTFPLSEEESGYRVMSGTSMAAPFVSGLAALIISKHSGPKKQSSPVRNNEELRRHLMRLATHPGHHDQHSGYGPLTTFQHLNVNLSEGDESAVSSIWIHGRQDEPSNEYDDRIDWAALSSNDYWYKLKNSGSGAYWAGEKNETLKEKIKAQSDCVGFLVRKNRLRKIKNGEKGHEKFILKTTPLKKNVYINNEKRKEPLCESVRFREQPSVKGRTAFIYAENYIVTANHCFEALESHKKNKEYWLYNVSDYRFVLDYKSKSTEKQEYKFPSRKVFDCIEAWGPQPKGNKYHDWCIIKVKASATVKENINEFEKRIAMVGQAFSESSNSQFLRNRKENNTKIPNTYLYTLGHPFGMPQKFTPDGRLLGLESGSIWKHDLDVFPGNSGSPVFSAKDFSLIGLVTETRVNSQWQEANDEDGNICYIHNENYHIKPSSRLQEIGSVEEAFQEIVKL